MKILRKYRMLMLFILIMLILMGTIMALENNQIIPESTSGKILISRWYIV